MIVNFLMSNQRLAKTISSTKTTPYPHTSDFTSFGHTANTIQEFHQLIKAYSDQGGCLLKGTLLHPLQNQSRAGSTNNLAPTKYLVLDIDRCNPEIETPEQFIQECLPPEFHDVDYIWQWSNSAKIKKHCLAGHFFFLLNKEYHPTQLKNQLIRYNWNARLEPQIKLTHNGMGLTYGLDPTCAQNDKLIFIAPPTLIDLEDPIPERISLVVKTQRSVVLTIDTPADLQHLKQTKVAELRAQAGLPRKKEKLKVRNDTEYLANPEKAVFQGPYITARDFVYGNLNNGDSYGYYHHQLNPYFLYNFKDEPLVRIKDIDPDYWQSLQPKKNNAPAFFAFRDRESDTYYTVEYDAIADSYRANPVSNAQKACSFLSLHEQPVPDDIPIWDYVFLPTENFVVDFAGQRLNRFQKSTYLKNAKPSTQPPYKFMELTRHVTGNDPAIHEDLINWLAFVIQKRTQTQTAYVLQGHTGTGKGVLFTKILQPLLGMAHCVLVQLDVLDGGFNDWMETAILAVFDESQMSEDPRRIRKRINILKNRITEPSFLLKKKFAHAVTVQNHTSFAFTSNEHDAVWITDIDRRFKIAPRQNTPINYTDRDIRQIENELQAIADYLAHYPVDVHRVRTIPHNEARARLIDANKTVTEQFIDIITNGDLATLMEFAHQPLTAKTVITAERYKTLMENWKNSVGTEIHVPMDDLRTAYVHAFGEDSTAAKFGRMLAHKGLHNAPRWSDGKTQRCVAITWHLPEEAFSLETPQCPGHTQNLQTTRNALTH